MLEEEQGEEKAWESARERDQRTMGKADKTGYQWKGAETRSAVLFRPRTVASAAHFLVVVF